MVNHAITKHNNRTIHLRVRDPETGKLSPQAIKFSTVLEYDSDVEIPVYEKIEAEWVQTHFFKLSNLLKAPKYINTIFDSLA